MSATADDVTRLVERVWLAQRRPYGRRVHALKLGRRQMALLRGYLQEQEQERATMIASIEETKPQATLYGIPVYEADADDHYELIYEDDAPALHALHEPLVQEPPAVWGKVEAP